MCPDRDRSTVLHIDNLSKSFGGITAANRINWSVLSGSCNCLIGPNGAGKSTLIKLVLGQEEPESGKIYFNGDDITGHHPFERVQGGIAVKPQGDATISNLTVQNNLRLAVQTVVKKRDVAEEVTRHLEELGLTHKRTMLAKYLSHGEKQWLAMRMAMAVNPKLLLLDEPTAGMSISEKTETADIISSWLSEDRARVVVIVDHDMSFVTMLDPFITVLNQGSVFAQGNMEEIKTNKSVQRIYLGTHQ